MRQIIDYHIPIQDYAEIIMPEGSKILHLDGAPTGITLWALCDLCPSKSVEIRQFRIVGEWQDMQESDELTYLGTFKVFYKVRFFMFEVKQEA